MIIGAPVVIRIFRKEFIEFGPHVFTTLWNGGGGLLMLYLTAGLPLGSILVATGGSMIHSSSTSVKRIILPLLGIQLIYFTYHAIASFRYTNVPSELFGFFGCLFVVLFLGLVFIWARKRSKLKPEHHGVIDLQLGSGICFLTALWQACGLASPPGFAIYPELAQKLSNQSFLISQVLAIDVFACLGFIFLLLAMRAQPLE